MKKLLLTATMLVAAAQAHATCATYNGTLPVAHWQQAEIAAKADRDQRPMFPQNRPIIDAAANAMYARIIADSALCEQNAIGFYEYQARVTGAVAHEF